MRIDLIDAISTVLYWFGLANLSAAMIIAIANHHPSTLSHSKMYWALLVCGIVPLVIGGFAHFSGWGLKPNSSVNSLPKSPRAPEE